jgi:hypothetical protein
MVKSKFSERHNLEQPVDIKYRDELPARLQEVLVDILVKFVGAKVVMDTARVLFDPFGIASFPRRFPGVGMSVHDIAHREVEVLKADAEWHQLYDLAEKIFENLDFYEEENRHPGSDEELRAYPLQQQVTKFFEHAGIGWKMHGGQIMSRSDAAFEASIDDAQRLLEATGRQTAASELREAISALSRRPAPNLSGAVFHAMAAMEAFARDVTGLPKATPGEIVKKRPTLFPKPLDQVLVGLWGYSSNNARHASEGKGPSRREAELVVRLAAALIVYVSDS